MTRPSQPGDGRTDAAAVAHDGAAAAAHAFERAERHQEGILAGEADDLAGDVAAVAAAFDHDPGADRHGMDRSGDLHHQAANADDAAIGFDAVEFCDLFGERFHAIDPALIKPALTMR